MTTATRTEDRMTRAADLLKRAADNRDHATRNRLKARALPGGMGARLADWYSAQADVNHARAVRLARIYRAAVEAYVADTLNRAGV
jgi:hypothetical protein